MKLNARQQKLLDKTIGLDVYGDPLLVPDNVGTSSGLSWRHHAVVSRLVRDDPESIVLGTLLMIRSRWNQMVAERLRKRFIDGFHSDLMAAIGVKDLLLLEHIKKSLPWDAQWLGSTSASCLAELMVALVHKDFDRASEKVEQGFAKIRKFPRWHVLWLEALSGVVTQQPDQVQQAIEQTLQGVSRLPGLEPAYKVVFPIAHDLWQIAEYCRPGLLENWTPEGKTRPWDPEYHQLLQSFDDADKLIPWDNLPEPFVPLFQVNEWT